jgi:hypothetical protein
VARTPPPGSLSAEDLTSLSDEQRRKLLERNPHLEELFRDVEKASSRAPKDTPARGPAPAQAQTAEPAPRPARKAARSGATDRPAARPRGASRRHTSGRRLASRIVRETPGLPGPSATNLILSFFGSTILVIGLVLLLGGGPRLGALPGWLGTAAGRLTSPTDPLF